MIQDVIYFNFQPIIKPFYSWVFLTVYAAQVILINGNQLKIVMVTSPIFINIETMMLLKNFGAPIIQYPFIYPRSVIVENDDSLVMAVGINDNQCSLVRLEGVAALLNEAIRRDQALDNNPSSSSCWDGCQPKQRENWQDQVYNEMNNWLRDINVAEMDDKFGQR